MFRNIIILLVLFLVPALTTAQVSEAGKPVKTVTDADIVGNTVWSSDTIWVMDHLCFVEDGETLTIEPGTIVKAKSGQAENSSALVVARGGQLFAEGSPARPIIFTAESDNVDDPADIAFDNTGRGLWGGIILLGRSQINTTAGVGQIEGIDETEPRARYGEVPPILDDNSGVLRYISIRHGGTDIGEANEINGLTMGAVGSGTTIDYVEVFMNKDDGFEWFGGTVNCKHIVAAYCGDDSFDYDEGFSGNGQFWFTILTDDAGNRCGEHDGGTNPVDGTPYAIPNIANATYIGSGSVSGYLENDYTFKIRDNAGGKYYNSIFTECADRAIDVEDLASGHDSRERLETGDLVFQTNIWWDYGAGSTVDDIVKTGQDYVKTYIFDPSERENNLVDPEIGGGGNRGVADGSLNPVPSTTGPAASGGFALTDPWFENVSYLGAFDPGVPADQSWLAHWTFLQFGGFIPGYTCCTGTSVGNLDCVAGIPDMGDLTVMIDHLFISLEPLCCVEEGDVDLSGQPNPQPTDVDMGDLTVLIDHLFISLTPLPACP